MYSTTQFEQAPIAVIGLLLLGLMAAAFVIGTRLHISLWRRQKRDYGSAHNYEGYIVSSVLGLLAILLGFTFSLAISRYEERRELVIAQANAIGTAYLRAQILAPPHRERLSRLLIQYSDTVIEIASAKRSQVHALIEKDNLLLTDIWAATAAAIDSMKSLPWSFAFADSINKMIDLDASRRNLRLTRIPTAVFAVLLIYLIGAAGVLGSALGVRPGRMAGAFVLFLMSLALLLIIDIDRPPQGLIRTDPYPLIQLRESLQSQPQAAFDRWRGEPAAPNIPPSH